jgi:hypothetical protein
VFYRRKIVLGLLQLFDGQLEKIRLQKLLFLATNQQDAPNYEFIPYRFGCYSYSANADMTAMVKGKLLSEDEKYFYKESSTDYLIQLKPKDRELLFEVESKYGRLSTTELMKLTYLDYPFYAINSEVASQILNKKELEQLDASKPNGTKTILFTIGYEGISLEEYLGRLLKNDVKVLIDVRHNPLSMKYGFSKRRLKKYCESLGIEYVHFPEVGIQSNKRKELKNQSDYDELFLEYRINNLPHTTRTQGNILKLLKKHKRIALTCFEANICQCHRKHLAEAIESLPSFSYEVKHI